MSFVPEPFGLPQTEQKRPDEIRPGSPLAVIGVFVEIVRRRFFPTEGLRWQWNTKQDQGTIQVESAYNDDNDVANRRPSIFVDREETVIGRTALGDRAGRRPEQGLDAFWGLQTIPITIAVVTSKRAEGLILGDIVQIYLHASSDLIQAKFGFHEMTPVTLGKPIPYEKDKTAWSTPITFTVQANVRWTNKRTAPILRAIALEVGSADATSYFESIALGETVETIAATE